MESQLPGWFASQSLDAVGLIRQDYVGLFAAVFHGVLFKGGAYRLPVHGEKPVGISLAGCMKPIHRLCPTNAIAAMRPAVDGMFLSRTQEVLISSPDDRCQESRWGGPWFVTVGSCSNRALRACVLEYNLSSFAGHLGAFCQTPN